MFTKFSLPSLENLTLIVDINQTIQKGKQYSNNLIKRRELDIKVKLILLKLEEFEEKKSY